VHGNPGGLIDHNKAWAFREQREGLFGRGGRLLVFGPRKGSHLNHGPRLQIQALFGLSDGSPVHPDDSPRQQAAHLGTREVKLLGEETIEALSAILLLDWE
jgi:hypothetical protein